MPASSKPLTEAALLKMPASAYMNADQLAFFRAASKPCAMKCSAMPPTPAST